MKICTHVYAYFGDVRKAQRAREVAMLDRPVHEWSEKRRALIASGLVDERRRQRELEPESTPLSRTWYR